MNGCTAADYAPRCVVSLPREELCVTTTVLIFFKIIIILNFPHPFPGVSGNSRSRPFPRMKASDSLSRIMGMDFFIPFPFPNFGNAFFSFPSRSRIMGMFFFIPFPFPNCGNGFFSFPSRSRIVGMDFFDSLPIPEFAISQTGIKTGIGVL